MATKIRLARHGRKKKPVYSIVVADSRAPRDGRFIEKLGTYNPNVEPHAMELHEERALHWVMVGAQPTDTVRNLLSKAGVMMQKHLQIGVNKGAISQDTADSRFDTWKKEKEDKQGYPLFTSKDNPVEPPVKELAPVIEQLSDKVVEAAETVKEVITDTLDSALNAVKDAIAPETEEKATDRPEVSTEAKAEEAEEAKVEAKEEEKKENSAE